MLRHALRIRSALRHVRSAPFQTATRLLHDSDDSPFTHDHASIDHKLEKIHSDMSKAIDNKIQSLSDRLVMEIKVLGTTMDARFETLDARFETSNAKMQSKFDGLRTEIQSKFDGLGIELKDREARFWARVVFTVLAVAGVTSSAALLQYQNRAIQSRTIQTPTIQTPAIQAPVVGQK